MSKNVSFFRKELAILKHNLKGAFKSTKDELDMHLDSINQNTNEIQSNYEYLSQLDSKIEKLTEKIDEIQMQLNPQFYTRAFDDIRLSRREQEAFLGLYTEEDRISVLSLSKKLGVRPDMCRALLTSLDSRGVPIVKQLVDGELLVSLDYTFKDLQARKNIVKIDTEVSQVLG